MIRKKYSLFIVSCIVLLLQACVSVQTPIALTDKYNEKKAYVYGKFTSISASPLAYAVGLRRIVENTPENEGKVYYIKFDSENKVSMLALPPGKYDINNISILDVLHFPIVKRRLFAKYDKPIYLEFQAGKAYYLGDLQGYVNSYVSYRTVTYQWKLASLQNNYEKSSAVMKSEFFSFGNIQTENAFANLLNTLDILNGSQDKDKRPSLLDIFTPSRSKINADLQKLNAPKKTFPLNTWDGVWVGHRDEGLTGDCFGLSTQTLEVIVQSGTVKMSQISDVSGDDKRLLGKMDKTGRFVVDRGDQHEDIHYIYSGQYDGKLLSGEWKHDTCKGKWSLKRK